MSRPIRNYIHEICVRYAASVMIAACAPLFPELRDQDMPE